MIVNESLAHIPEAFQVSQGSCVSQPGWCWSQQKVKGRLKGEIFTLPGTASLLPTKPCFYIVCTCVDVGFHCWRILDGENIMCCPSHFESSLSGLLSSDALAQPQSCSQPGKKFFSELLLDDFFSSLCIFQLTLTSEMAYCFAYS